MLVPRTRLILWTALIVLPFAAVGATLPGALAVSVLMIGALAFIVVFDGLVAGRTLAGIRVDAADLARLQKDRPGSLELRIFNDALQARELRLGIALPREIVSDSDERVALLPASAALSRLDWPVTPIERGQFFLDRVHLEAVSPFDFWAVRSSQPIRAELRVYPIFSERKNVAAVFLRRGNLGSLAAPGAGPEFEKLREHVPGDSYDEIIGKLRPSAGIR